MRSRASILLLLPAVMACSLGEGEQKGPPPTRPNLVLISVDTLRADHLGTYGYERATSPTFDRLASEGIVFTNAVAPSTWTLPSHATLLTGATPFRHGAISATSAIAGDVATLAERLRAEGYVTVGVANGTFLSPHFGFDRGFDRYMTVPAANWRGHQEAVLHAVRATRRRPAFFFFHYMKVHDPYDPPPRFDRFRRPYRGSVPNALRPIMHAWRTGGMRSPVISDADRDHLVDLYDGSILFMDSLLATLLGALEGLGLGPTYVIVTSDHGEEFLEHRLLGHGLTLYEEVLRVPLVIRGPGIAAGRRTEALAGLVDLVPTSLDLLGLPIPAELAGRSLRPLWEGNDDPWPERTLLLRTSFINGKGVRLGVRSSDAKLVVDPGRGHRVFFDLRRDPAEGEGRPQGPGAQRLASRLEGVDPARAGQPVALSGDEVEQLRALGYMDAPAAPPTPAP